jgi:AraC family transcriptional regulator
MMPHRFVFRTRLDQATVSQSRTSDSISTIAFDAGFNDLSTFDRRFRRMIGLSLSAHRSRWGGTTRFR